MCLELAQRKETGTEADSSCLVGGQNRTWNGSPPANFQSTPNNASSCMLRINRSIQHTHIIASPRETSVSSFIIAQCKDQRHIPYNSAHPDQISYDIYDEYLERPLLNATDLYARGAVGFPLSEQNDITTAIDEEAQAIAKAWARGEAQRVEKFGIDVKTRDAMALMFDSMSGVSETGTERKDGDEAAANGETAIQSTKIATPDPES